MSGESLFRVALQLSAYGLACLPIIPMSKKALIPWQQYQSNKPTISDYARWFRNTKANIAVLCGPVSNNLVVLDFDTVPAYFRTRFRYPLLRDTYTIKSSRGYHAYLFVNELPDRTLKVDEIDVKATGYVVTAPSLHPSGIEYTVHNESEIVRIESLAEVGIDRATPDNLISCEASAPLSEVAQGATNTNIRYRRFTADQITQIKARKKITSLFSLVHNPKNQPKVMTRCPMPAHENGDVNPSLALDITNNRCHCFKPSCPLHTSRGCSVIDAYCILYNLSFKDAVIKLAAELGL